MFFSCFFCLTPLGLESSSSRKTALFLTSLGWRNTKIYIHRASRMERKPGKCWKLQLFEAQFQVFIRLSKWNENSQYVLLLFFILALFATCFYHFLFWRYLNSSMTCVFFINSAAISRFDWFEQPWTFCIHFVHKHFEYILHTKVCQNVGYILYTNILHTFCIQNVYKNLSKYGIYFVYKHFVYILYTSVLIYKNHTS